MWYFWRMMRKPLSSGWPLLLILPLILSACNGPKPDDKNTYTYQVNSARVPCTGVAPMECLQIRRGDAPDWQLFYSEIEGFDYEPGYLYRIRVQEEQLDPEKVPADGSSIRYTLVSVDEKKPDPRLRLNDIWVLREMEGEPVPEEDLPAQMQRPYIEFHIRDNRYMGNDGCNTFRGQIDSAGEKALSLSPAMSTKMSCGDMALPTAFLRLLSRVDSYRAETGKLILLEGETELLKFHKTD